MPDVNAQTVIDIDAVIQQVGEEERRKLDYIREQLTPEGFAARTQREDGDDTDLHKLNGDVSHLRWVARDIIRNHNRQEAPA